MMFYKATHIWLAALLATTVTGHARVWSVWINGVDQGTEVGIRNPPYNGPPLSLEIGNVGRGSGVSTSPVKNLTSIDMRCNVLGEQQNPYTHQVKPGDVITFEWHFESRAADDQINPPSHMGAGVVYITEDPPKENSWVKIQQEAIINGTYYTTAKLIRDGGKQSVQVPADLAPGPYLLRAEISAVHYAAFRFDQPLGKDYGFELYPSCVQINVTGTGNVKLPSGVSFPGAYKYTDPGVLFNLFNDWSRYQVPGPPVWTGAAASPLVSFGKPKGHTTATRWSSWIAPGPSSLITSVQVVDEQGNRVSATIYPYTNGWSEVYQTPTVTQFDEAPRTTSSEPQPTATVTVPKWAQCGGINYQGITACISGTTCQKLNDYYSQCL